MGLDKSVYLWYTFTMTQLGGKTMNAQQKIHEILEHNFHGWHQLRFRGPAEGFRLSAAQSARYARELCGKSGCTCGGSYGEGPAKGWARIEIEDYSSAGTIMRLIPATEKSE